MNMQLLVSFISGITFAVGLSISGMTKPSKVQGFLDIFGQWDYSLAFVMVGGILVHTIAYLIKKKTSKPMLNPDYQVPNNKTIDKNLILGGVLFGMGWGLAGFCPGPGITALASGALEPLIFVVSMTVGMFAFDLFQKVQSKKA